MTYIPSLSKEEEQFLNAAASYSQARRIRKDRKRAEQDLRRSKTPSGNTLSFLWKRRDSSSSTSTNTTSISLDYLVQHEKACPKAKELESLIFNQPQRTVRLSLTPRCAF